MNRLVSVLFFVFVLAGCSSGGEKSSPSIYLLRASQALPEGQVELTAPVSVGIGRVLIADYLAGDGVVVMTGQNKLYVSRQHLWAEPLDSAIELFIRDLLSAELGFPVLDISSDRTDLDYRVDIRIDEWHGSLEGSVTLVASWTLIDMTNSRDPVAFRFRQSMDMTEDGYDALVETQTALLSKLTTRIAESLKSAGSAVAN